MKGLTRTAGIAYNLEISPHKFDVTYRPGEVMTFVFSSELYRRKFSERMEENRKEINESLSNRFGFKVEHNILCDLRLYTKIEKRGFLLYWNGRGVKWQDEVKINGSISL